MAERELDLLAPSEEVPLRRSDSPGNLVSDLRKRQLGYRAPGIERPDANVDGSVFVGDRLDAGVSYEDERAKISLGLGEELGIGRVSGGKEKLLANDALSGLYMELVRYLVGPEPSIFLCLVEDLAGNDLDRSYAGRGVLGAGAVREGDGCQSPDQETKGGHAG